MSARGDAREVVASVIIPAYNAADVLGAQLEALAEQRTVVPWELVVADNGSTDGTRALVETFRSRVPHLQFVDASRTRGPAFARNAGADAARGDLLLFCDADDVAAPTWLDEMVRALASAEFVGGRLEYSRLNSPDVHAQRDPLQLDALGRFLGRPFTLSANMACTRRLFAAIGGFDPGLREAGEDIDFSIRAAKAGHVPQFARDAVISYRLRTTLWESIAQGRAYGRGCHAVIVRHPEIASDGGPRMIEDGRRSYRLAKRALRAVLHRRPVPMAVWFDAAVMSSQIQAMARMRVYWRVDRLRDPDAPTFRANQARRARAIAGRVQRRLDPKPPAAADAPRADSR